MNWKAIVDAVTESTKTQPTHTRTIWPHQLEMHAAGVKVLQKKVDRVRIIAATGGGKTFVECRLLRDGFEKFDHKIQVIVAPTIALLSQHDVEFYGFGLFDAGNVSTLHFRTGADSRLNGKNNRKDYDQSTSSKKLLEKIRQCHKAKKKLMVFVTYASVEAMFEVFTKYKIQIDLTVWDEFHHCVRQDHVRRTFIRTLPSTGNIFFSASQKHGRLMSSFDKETFGEVGANITFSYLRNNGYLVPKVTLKLLRLNQVKRMARGLSERMKKEGEREGVDMDDAALEAACVIKAREDMQKNVGPSNIIVFGKQCAMGEIEHRSPTVKSALKGAMINAVYGNTPQADRIAAFESIRTSTDSVLWQHSVVKEGIDVTAFNAGIFSRRMDVIGVQQGLGRIVRKHDIGWKKECAVLYVVVDDDNMEGFADDVSGLIRTLLGCGLIVDKDIDLQLEDTEEDRTGKKRDESGLFAPVVTNALIEKSALQAKLNKLKVEVVELEEHDLAYDATYAERSKLEDSDLI